MKFRILSDIHLEQRNDIKNPLIGLEKCDYLILAGDITNFVNIRKIEIFIKEIENDYDKIFYILGNHEYYQKPGNVDANNVISVYRKLEEKCNKLIVLENQWYDLGKIRIFGATLWSNITREGEKTLNDKRTVSRTWVISKHNESKKIIESLDPNIEHLIVTHHLPSFKLIDEKYIHETDMNSGFASDCEYLFEKHIKYWVYGHTHTPYRKIMGQIEFICNSVGYENENGAWNDCIINY